MASSIGNCTAAEFQSVLALVSDLVAARNVCELFNVSGMGASDSVLSYSLQQVVAVRHTCTARESL